jgi:hypothetical protein
MRGGNGFDSGMLQRTALLLLGALVAAVAIPMGAFAQDQPTPVFSEDFSASDGSPWDPQRWEVLSLSPPGDVVDVQSGRGRITVAADSVAVHARPQLELAEVSFYVGEPPGPEPSRWTAYFTVGPEKVGTSYLLRKNAGEAAVTLYRESDSGATLAPLGELAATDATSPLRVRYQLATDAVRVRAWPDGTQEPTAWNLDIAEAVPAEARQFAFVGRVLTSDEIPTPSPKTWYLDDVAIGGETVSPGQTGLRLTPESATVLAGGTHTVTASGAGDGGPSGSVTFEVYRETAAEPPETTTVRQLVETTVVTVSETGTASFSYSAATERDDWIAACVVPAGERCTTGETDSGVGIQPRADVPVATATATWRASLERSLTVRSPSAQGYEPGSRPSRRYLRGCAGADPRHDSTRPSGSSEMPMVTAKRRPALLLNSTSAPWLPRRAHRSHRRSSTPTSPVSSRRKYSAAWTSKG